MPGSSQHRASAQGCPQTPGGNGHLTVDMGHFCPTSCSPHRSCQARTCFRTRAYLLLFREGPLHRESHKTPSLTSLQSLYQGQLPWPSIKNSLNRQTHCLRCPCPAAFLFEVITTCHMVCLFVHCLSSTLAYGTEMSAL